MANKSPISILIQYSNYADVFSLEFAFEFSEYIEIKNHAIEQIDKWQLLYKYIYS